jgi:peptide-methionine (S)-S-oxide reductase
MKEERAILAGGCFWGMQNLIRRLDGISQPRYA